MSNSSLPIEADSLSRGLTELSLRARPQSGDLIQGRDAVPLARRTPDATICPSEVARDRAGLARCDARGPRRDRRVGPRRAGAAELEGTIAGNAIRTVQDRSSRRRLRPAPSSMGPHPWQKVRVTYICATLQVSLSDRNRYCWIVSTRVMPSYWYRTSALLQRS